MNNFLAITYAFMLAYCPCYNVGVEREKEVYKDSTHAVFQIGVELFNCVDLYAGEETYQVPYENVFKWLPFTQSYWLGVEWHKTFNEKLELYTGIKHKCQHSVNAWNLQLSNFNQAYTELYIGIKGKVDIF